MSPINHSYGNSWFRPGVVRFWRAFMGTDRIHRWGVAILVDTVMTPEELIDWFTRKLPLEVKLHRLDIHPDPSVLFGDYDPDKPLEAH